MKKILRVVGLTLAVMSLFSVSVFAANNTYYQFLFTANSQKRDSTPVVKEADGDTNAYVTTITNPGDSLYNSNIFINDGCFYARSRYTKNTEGVKSDLFDFTTNERQVKPYLTTPVWRTTYILRAELDHTDFTGSSMYQWVRWCP